jgi:hypothetical protein
MMLQQISMSEMKSNLIPPLTTFRMQPVQGHAEGPKYPGSQWPTDLYKAHHLIIRTPSQKTPDIAAKKFGHSFTLSSSAYARGSQPLYLHAQ